jgi:membrane protease YdiL (CAAX protease family)
LASPHSTPYPSASRRNSSRQLAELLIGFVAIVAVLWLPTHEQLIFGPVALFAPLLIVLAKRPSPAELGLSKRGMLASFWILPAAIGLTFISVFVAKKIGTYHPLYDPDFGHVYGYMLWTFYQQFLLQDYFMPRLTSVLSSDGAIAAAAVLFAVAHLPNLSLVLATLVWGAVSCWLFRRYRSLYVLGLAQGILGLCFAVCIPDAMHHHMRVGLGYIHYHVASVQALQHR